MRGDSAWIVDGATGVYRETLTPGASDAAWLAGEIDRTLEAAVETTASHSQILSDLEAALSTAYQPFRRSGSGDLGPAACLGLISARPAGDGFQVEGAFLGDVVALIPQAGSVMRWTDERSKPFERRTLAALDKGAERGSPLLTDAVRSQIAENRRHLNREGGYWMVQPERPWAGREISFQADVEAGETLVLATDGFMRLVDVFGVYSDETLHAAFHNGKGDDLLRELRDLESSDPVAGSTPRVKTHDDATVLVLKVVG